MLGFGYIEEDDFEEDEDYFDEWEEEDEYYFDDWEEESDEEMGFTEVESNTAVSSEPKFGMTSSEAVAVDPGPVIEDRDGIGYTSVSDYVKGENGYEPLDE